MGYQRYSYSFQSCLSLFFPSSLSIEEDKDLAKNMARFAFCKEDASLHEASRRLKALRDNAINPSLLPSVDDETVNSTSSN